MSEMSDSVSPDSSALRSSEPSCACLRRAPNKCSATGYWGCSRRGSTAGNLVSAPAGYGKTILLSQWLTSEETNGAFAWVSLDEQDNDPIRLWRHIVEALGHGVPGKGLAAPLRL